MLHRRIFVLTYARQAKLEVVEVVQVVEQTGPLCVRTWGNYWRSYTEIVTQDRAEVEIISKRTLKICLKADFARFFFSDSNYSRAGKLR